MLDLNAASPIAPARAARADGRPRHGFSVDVEDYFMVLNFQQGIPRSEWKELPQLVEPATERILQALRERDLRGTFFILGCVAEQWPDLVRRIAAEGHEVASHGWSHAPITKLDPESFAVELLRSKRLLEDLSGQTVEGFRAPSFSVRQDTRWALDVLLDCGYRYDSSVFPVRHPDYGIPDAQRDLHELETPQGRRILEFPMTVAKALGRNVPVSGGGWFRLLPYAVTRWGFRQLDAHGRSGVFYLHPWEVAPEQPNLRHRTTKLKAFRHYTNLDRTLARLERLLDEFHFAPMRDVMEDLLAQRAAAEKETSASQAERGARAGLL